MAVKYVHLSIYGLYGIKEIVYKGIRYINLDYKQKTAI